MVHKKKNDLDMFIDLHNYYVIILKKQVDYFE